MTDRIAKIEQRLKSALQIEHIEIIDESHKHAGHKGAIESGGGHFKLHLVSADFADQSLIKRHRLVYDALGELMQTEIHALSIASAKAPGEA